MSDTPIVIDTPDGIEHYTLLVHIHRLRVELKTGMTFRASTCASARAKYGCEGKRRSKVLWELEELYRERYGRYPEGTVR